MPLTPLPKVCLEPTCDVCDEGDNSEYGSSFHYLSAKDAWDVLQGGGWVVLYDGRLLCEQCYDRLKDEHERDHNSPCVAAHTLDCPIRLIEPGNEIPALERSVAEGQTALDVGPVIHGIIGLNNLGKVCFFPHSRATGIRLDRPGALDDVLQEHLDRERRVSFDALRAIDPPELR